MTSFLKTLREKNVQRCEESFHNLYDWSLTDWATAVSGEVGELCNIVKKIRRGDFPRNQVQKELEKEIADAILYLDLFAARIEVDLEEIITQKFNEVSERVNSEIKL